MYKFNDTTSKEVIGTTLPTEAMNYNGFYLENEIDGYRTLSVSGRELMEAEIKRDEIDGMDGATYRYRTVPSRTITVQYQLIAENASAFRTAFNKMNRILSAEQVKIIFADEDDKYFIGTKTDNTEVDSGLNSIVGEIEIECSDPYKYSTTLKEFTSSDGTVTITNDGTAPAEIDYEITMNAESGYLGIVSTEGTMEYGKIDEADGEDYQQNEVLATLQDLIDCEDDTTGTDVMHPYYGHKGTCKTHTWFDKTFLGFGTKGEKVGTANGGMRTFTLPADSEGNKGCKNWYCYMHVIDYAGLMGQLGEMSISFLTEDDKFVAGLNWFKTDGSGNTGYYEFGIFNQGTGSYVNYKPIRQWTFTTSHLQSQNPWYWNWGHCDILKEGSKIRFFYWGGYYTYDIPEIENMEVAKIQFAIKQYGDNASKFLTYLGMDVLTFQKMHVDKWKNVPNRYSKDSTISIDGEDGKFYLNGMEKQSEEVLGTQYFKAPSGETQVNIHVSDWCETAPTVTARIRERWL